MRGQQEQLEDIFYLLPTESLSKILRNAKIDFEILLPVQMPAGTDSGQFSLSAQFSLDDVFSAILKLLLYDPTHSNIDYYKQFLISFKPEVKEDLLDSALKKMEEKDFFSAEIFFKILIELSQEDEDISFLSYNLAISLETQASLFITLDRKEEAQIKIRELKELYQSFSSQAEDSNIGDLERLVDLNLVQEQIALGKKEEALEGLTKILDEKGPSWDVWFLKGWILRNLKRYEEALECFQESTLLSQPTIDILMEQFICFFQLESFLEAEKLLQTALSLDNEDSRVYFNFGLLFYRVGDPSEALSFFKKGLSYEPNDPMAISFIETIEKELKSKN